MNFVIFQNLRFLNQLKLKDKILSLPREQLLSQLLDGEISHDAISRFLSEREYTSKDLWKQVKWR
jgi:hypothetical protein